MKKVLFICLLSLLFSCNSYSGNYSDSFGITSMTLNNDGTFESASCNGKWKEVEGGVRIYDVSYNGFGRSNCDYEGFYKSYLTAGTQFQGLLGPTGISWIKK